MNYLSSTCLWIAGPLICVIFSLFSIGAASYGIYTLGGTRFTKVKCNDTNCTVNVVNGVCFAKILDLTDDGVEPKKVECDKKRKGNYEVILPCDITKHGNPKINCIKKNKDKNAGFILLIVFIAFSGVFCLASSFFLVALSPEFYEDISKEIEIEKQIEDAKSKKRRKIKSDNDFKMFKQQIEINTQLEQNQTVTDSNNDDNMSKMPHDDL